ncbi:hypothetical protein GH714_028774 [Hevea brasiliensis]|uniref:FAD dependent oxidoreductase domain-containing protein n=1 Tax=Hevea brasiliensis TaxID=3981 RepID=A0A6A6NBL8_HEVBR|nr:hypothetical protein GH714_028774 [Hevea brasiliensis]
METIARKKVVIVGSGWAGLGAAHHLCNQGFDVTVLDDGNDFGNPDDVAVLELVFKAVTLLSKRKEIREAIQMLLSGLYCSLFSVNFFGKIGSD